MNFIYILLLASLITSQGRPVAQVGIDSNTGTPIMGCTVSGDVLWRADLVDTHVNTDKGFMHRKQVKWRISREKTLLGDKYLRNHYECWPDGITPETK